MSILSFAYAIAKLAKPIIFPDKPDPEPLPGTPDNPYTPPTPGPPPPNPSPNVPPPPQHPACDVAFTAIAGSKCVAVTDLVRRVGLDHAPGSLNAVAAQRDPGFTNLSSRMFAIAWIATASFLANAILDKEVAAMVRAVPGRLADYMSAWWVVKAYSETRGSFLLDSHNLKTGYHDYGLLQIIRKTGVAGSKRSNKAVPSIETSWNVPGVDAGSPPDSLIQALVAGAVACGFFDMMDARLHVNQEGDFVPSGADASRVAAWNKRLRAIDDEMATALAARGFNPTAYDKKALRFVCLLDCSWSAGPGVANPDDDVWLKKGANGSYVSRSAMRTVIAYGLATSATRDGSVADVLTRLRG